jgi:hypothetical protein
MSVLIWLVGAWLTLNAALVAALWFRRPNPKLRAVRRLWIMLSAAKEAGQLSRGQPPKNSSPSEEFSRIKLSDAGIYHKLSARSQKVVDIDGKPLHDSRW